MKRTALPKRRVKPRRTLQDRNPEYRWWLREEAWCEVCGSPRLAGDRLASCDPCHTQNGGASLKGPDSGCAPLCREHHDRYDGRAKLPNGEVGRKAFEAYYGIDMAGVAAKWYALFLEQR